MSKVSSTAHKDAATPLRIAVYVDGFNLYFGLKDAGLKRYYWLDIWRLAENLARGGSVCLVKYFTARIKANPAKERRQRVFLHGLGHHRPALEIILGHYLLKPWQCRSCGHVWQVPEEKRTDVNICLLYTSDAADE